MRPELNADPDILYTVKYTFAASVKQREMLHVTQVEITDRT